MSSSLRLDPIHQDVSVMKVQLSTIKLLSKLRQTLSAITEEPNSSFRLLWDVKVCGKSHPETRVAPPLSRELGLIDRCHLFVPSLCTLVLFS